MRLRRDYWLLGLAVILLAAAGWWMFGRSGLRVAETPAVAPSAAPPVQEAAKPPPAPSTAPGFDAVQVGPDGRVVIAGRAAPGAQVTILDHGQAIGQVTADPNGEWVFIPDQPLPPGPRELSLAARTAGATSEERSTATIAVLVPNRPTAGPPVAVVLPQGPEAAHMLQPPSGRQAHRVTLDIVEYEASGRTVLSGDADPGATVDVAIGDRHLASATADSSGTWSTALTAGVPEGMYRLQLAARDADGSAGGDATLTLRRASTDELAGADYFAVVPGNNLWHLARRSYGDGLRYLEIYRANQAKIANPDLIYPNQLLAVPGKS